MIFIKIVLAISAVESTHLKAHTHTHTHTDNLGPYKHI